MQPIKKVLNLGKIAYTSKAKRNEVGLELNISTEGTASKKRDWITLKNAENVPRISICGHVWNACRTDWATGGQITETIRAEFAHNEKVQRICQLWDEWHLNDMKAGTQAQTAVIQAYRLALADGVTGLTGAEAVANVEKLRAKFGVDYHKTAEDVLKRVGLYVDRGYKYGHGWLIAVPPQEVITELVDLFS